MKFKIISYCILLLILTQSCVIYRSEELGINETVGKGRVKIITKDGEKIKYKKIVRANQTYFGVKNKYYQPKIIDKSSIDYVKVVNEPLTTVAYFVSIVAVGLGVYVGIMLLFYFSG